MAQSQRKVVGSVKRADVEFAQVQGIWGTDRIEDADPDFSYQFMHKDEVHDRSGPKRVLDRRTGEIILVDGWTVCADGDRVKMAGKRPDEAAPVDTTYRQGPHVLMKIPKRDHELLLHEKDAQPDAMEERLMRGGMAGQWGDGTISQVNLAYAPHQAKAGQQGGKDYSQKEQRLANELGKMAGA